MAINENDLEVVRWRQMGKDFAHSLVGAHDIFLFIKDWNNDGNQFERFLGPFGRDDDVAERISHHRSHVCTIASFENRKNILRTRRSIRSVSSDKGVAVDRLGRRIYRLRCSKPGCASAMII